MATNTTNSQAASIADDQEFFRLRLCWLAAVNEGNEEDADIAHYAMCELIDAKLAQAREEGRRYSHETNVTMLNLKLKAEDRAIAAEARAEKAEQYAQVALGIKDSLEARLAEMQRGMEGLQRYGFDGTFGGDFGKNSLGCYVKADAVIALLQSQGQASDTSGLLDDQIIQRAGEIFGFKPHKQDEVNKQKFLDFARWVKEEV